MQLHVGYKNVNETYFRNFDFKIFGGFFLFILILIHFFKF